MLKRTPLYATHQKQGAKLIEFGGWEMPVYYTSIVDEHKVVRSAVGLFDISHMGEIWVEGKAAAGFLNYVLTNDTGKLRPGLGQYTLLCNESGGAVDDLYVFQIDEAKYLLIVNASRIPEDEAWLRKQWQEWPDKDQVELDNVSDRSAAVAVQGPKSAELMDACFQGPALSGTIVKRPSDLKKNEIARFPFGEEEAGVFISRTGYTGEDGFEVVAYAEQIVQVWDRLVQSGHPYCLQPAGLGARDTLRTEACYPLYGHELNETTSPLEAGLGFAVALSKEDFIGKKAMQAQKETGMKRQCAAFKMEGRSAPPRQDYPIWSANDQPEPIGAVTSGTQSPSLGIGIGLGMIPPACALPEGRLLIEIRGRQFPAVVVKKPFVKPGK